MAISDFEAAAWDLVAQDTLAGELERCCFDWDPASQGFEAHVLQQHGVGRRLAEIR